MHLRRTARRRALDCGACRLSDDPEIVIKLPLSAWRIVMQHLQMGTFSTVFGVVSALCEQADPQINLAAAASPSRVSGDDPGAPAPKAAERLN
jgi:hypothetical protein